MSEIKPQEYWRWPEYRHTVPDKDWRNAKIITAGVDVGSVGSKAVVVLDGELYAYSVMRTGGVSEATAVKVVNWALEETGLKPDNLQYVVGTGYGRVNVTFAKKNHNRNSLPRQRSPLHIRSNRQNRPRHRRTRLQGYQM